MSSTAGVVLKPFNANDQGDGEKADYSPDYSGNPEGRSDDRLQALAEVLRGLTEEERESLRKLLATVGE
ncbi:MAG: hypothetical protein IT364_19295 [Candidatus Hydrogenedentes bacterium]|nr:hypothetical protein [Candidatus Hydrogenedentota bacterium]